MDETWTLTELEDAVAAALADGDAPNGRVRAVPDARAIRYYTTIGLLDRPTLEGRAARYGRRHLLQLVAIKRLQSQGRSLAQVQEALAGATSGQLERIARLAAGDTSTSRARRERFWDARGAATPTTPEPAAEPAEPPAPGPRPARRTKRDNGRPLLQGVPLAGGAVLLVPTSRPLTHDDVDAVRAAATDLTSLLAARGLVQHPDTDTEDPS